MSDTETDGPPVKKCKVVRIKHFVQRFLDESLDYISICKAIFDGGEYLCVKEFGDNNKEHVHFQGTTSFSDETLKTKSQELITKVHRLTREYEVRAASNPKEPKPRIVAWKGGVCDSDGYGYLSKDPRRVVLATSFSDEKILEFSGQSKEYVSKLKTEYNVAMWDKLTAWYGKRKYPVDDKLLNRLKAKVNEWTIEWYLDQEKAVPFKLLQDKILNVLLMWTFEGHRVFKVSQFCIYKEPSK